MTTIAQFSRLFSIPREPATGLSPGQYFELKVTKGKKVLVTDIYIENLGGGMSSLRILEQRGANTFEVRYTFRTAANQVTMINLSTGLQLGDETPIKGSIRIENEAGTAASIIPRVNGAFVG